MKQSRFVMFVAGLAMFAVSQPAAAADPSPTIPVALAADYIHAVIEADFGSVLANGFDRAHPVLRVFDFQADVQRFDSHPTKSLQ